MSFLIHIFAFKFSYLMKLVSAFLVLGCFITGCTDNGLSPKHLSRISVIRESELTPADNKKNAPASPKTEIQQPKQQQPTPPAPPTQPAPPQQSHVQYHVIVASYSASEKAKAEKMVAKLRAKNYPATLLYSSQRYRISIESFTSEAEANEARDDYRSITDKQDIWVHKVY